MQVKKSKKITGLLIAMLMLIGTMSAPCVEICGGTVWADEQTVRSDGTGLEDPGESDDPSPAGDVGENEDPNPADDPGENNDPDPNDDLGEGNDPDPAVDPGQTDQDGWIEGEDGLRYYKEGELVTGFHEIEGETYYFDPESGLMQTGSLEIEGKTYYFDPERGSMQTGFVTLETGKYYFDPADGTMKTGLRNIDGSKYYFAASGIMKTGLVKISGKLYYFKASGKATTAKGWTDAVPGGKRYGYGNGTIAIGKKKIGSNWYYFYKATGKLHTKGFFTVNGYEYYCTGAGKLATGWKAIGDHGYYFYKKSAIMAKGKTIGYLKIPKSGRLHKAYAQGIRVLNKKGWTLRAAYNYSSKSIRYAHKGMRKKTSEAYATYGFTNRKGNCFVMAGTFYVMAKLLGYDVHQVKGHVGVWCPHSWTTIKQNGKKYVYDPQFRNRTGRNGFKIYYGKKGTWRYNRMKNMN